VAVYVALLRSVNVGGRNRVAMADLRTLVEKAGYEVKATYLQSGNVVLAGSGSEDSIARSLEAQLATLGLSVPVVVRTRSRLAAVVRAMPFGPEPEGDPPEAGVADAVGTGLHDPKTWHVTFLSREPEQAAVDDLDDRSAQFGDDRFEVVGQEVYLSCPGGYGETKLTNAYLERRLGSTATTRNWRTVTALAALAAG